jgi:hypothetical protein
VEANRDQLEQIAAANGFERVPESDRGAGREIRRAQPRGWEEHLSRKEIKLMHEVLADKLDELGYLRPGDVRGRRAA